MTGEDIPCAAGVRGDGPCSFELCPPGIGCRRVREQRALGEEARVTFKAALAEGLFEEAHEHDDGWGGGFLFWEGVAAAAVAILNDADSPLPALIAQARADGAAEERERIARRFDSMDGDGLGSLAPVVTGLFEQVARIVRATS
jgi:hypothetical protein